MQLIYIIQQKDQYNHLQMNIARLFLLLLISPILNFTPQLVQLELEIANLQSWGQILANERYSEFNAGDDIKSQSIQRYYSTQIEFTQKCSFSGNNSQGFIFQTTTQIYLAVNFPLQDMLKIFNSQCHELSSLKNVQARQFLSDRGVSQSGIVYFVGKDDHLYHIYQQGGFRNSLKISNLSGEFGMVGGAVRYRGKQRVQIYVGYENGEVKVYDESGNNKLRLQLQGFSAEIGLFSDHHPYPLMVAKSDWISMLDTSKYLQIEQNCPHIPNIKYILPENMYGDTIYVINSDKIYVMTVETGKRLCSIKREYDLFHEVKSIRKASFFSNLLFFDTKVFNFTERKLYQIEGCSGELSYEFVSKKNQNSINYCLRMCCNRQHCNVEFSEVKKVFEDKGIFLWLIISFVIVLFVSLSFIKKSNVSNLDYSDASSDQERAIDRHIYELSKKTREKNNKKKK